MSPVVAQTRHSGAHHQRPLIEVKQTMQSRPRAVRISAGIERADSSVRRIAPVLESVFIPLRRARRWSAVHRHRPFFIAGDWHELPRRVRARHPEEMRSLTPDDTYPAYTRYARAPYALNANGGHQLSVAHR